MKKYESITVYFDLQNEEENKLYNALREQAFRKKGEAMSKCLKDGATKILKKKKYL